MVIYRENDGLRVFEAGLRLFIREIVGPMDNWQRAKLAKMSVGDMGAEQVEQFLRVF